MLRILLNDISTKFEVTSVYIDLASPVSYSQGSSEVAFQLQEAELVEV